MTAAEFGPEQATKVIVADLAREYGVTVSDEAVGLLAERMRRGFERAEKDGRLDDFEPAAKSVASRLGMTLTAGLAVAGADSDEALDAREALRGVTIGDREVDYVFAALCPGFWPFC